MIAGATTAEQVAANVAAAAWEPTDDDLAALDELTAGRPRLTGGRPSSFDGGRDPRRPDAPPRTATASTCTAS